MAFSQRQPCIFTPQTLREALGLSFNYRERVRWLVGSSRLLAVTYTHVPRDAQIVDARGVADLRMHALGDEKRARFGAFAGEDALRGHPLLDRTLFAGASPSLYLAVADATVEVISLGRTRTTPMEALCLAPHEVPLAIELQAGDAVYLQRRRAVSDGTASHELTIAATFRFAGDGRVARARVALSIDGARPIRARLAEHHLEGARLAAERMTAAARLCAEAIPPHDARTAAAARSAWTLGLALFKEAVQRRKENLRAP